MSTASAARTTLESSSRMSPNPTLGRRFRERVAGRWSPDSDERNPDMNAATTHALADERVLHKQDAPAVVSAGDLVRRYGEGDTAVDALRDVSLDISAGELTAVMGPSGSGKST